MPRVIPLLTEMSLQEVLDQPFIQEELGPLMERHRGGDRVDCASGRRWSAGWLRSTLPTS